jgi:flagellar protein FlaF
MAGAIIIACAIGILLLLLVGYVLVGSTLTSADSIASAQKDMTIKKEAQMNTAIQISNEKWENRPGLDLLMFDLKNTGTAPIGDFNHTDMFISLYPDYIPVRYSFCGVASGNITGYGALKTWGYTTITPDTTHPFMLDPGETMAVNITFNNFDGGWKSYFVNVSTPNGITAVGVYTAP